MNAQNHNRFLRPVLVVEDELFIGLDVAEELESRGFAVYGPISNVESASKVVDTYHFSAAVLDFRLQDGNSHILAERLQEKNVPVIFYTGNPEEAARHPVARHATLLSKPAMGSEIADAVAEVAVATA